MDKSITVALVEAGGAGSGQVSGREPGTRYHHLDAVRGFALLLGVFFHAAESFGPRNNYWAIVDCSPSEFLEGVRFACHAFRLELFFVIAGFFARFLLVRRGTAGFVKNRVQRILVPLVVGWVVVYPLLVAIWIWGASIAGRLREFGVPQEALNLPVWQLTLGFFMTGGFLQKFDLTHLWFLHQLLVIYALALGVKWVVARCDAAGAKMARVDGWFKWIWSRPGTLYWFLAPSILMLLLMRSWVVDTPKESLLPYVPTTLFVRVLLSGGLAVAPPAGVVGSDRAALGMVHGGGCAGVALFWFGRGKGALDTGGVHVHLCAYDVGVRAGVPGFIHSLLPTGECLDTVRVGCVVLDLHRAPAADCGDAGDGGAIGDPVADQIPVHVRGGVRGTISELSLLRARDVYWRTIERASVCPVVAMGKAVALGEAARQSETTNGH